MTGQRERGGLPLPTLWQGVVIVAALTAVGLAWTKYGQYVEHERGAPDVSPEFVGNPLKDLHSVEAFVRRRADAIPELVVALDSSDPRERGLAAYGLGRIGPEAVDSLEKIRRLLSDVAPEVRERAVFAVSQISEDKGAAATDVAPLLADPEPRVHESASRALSQIGAASLPSIRRMLQSDQPATRLRAVQILRRTSDFSATWRGAHEAIASVLRTVTGDPDRTVRLEAIAAAAERNQATADEIDELVRTNDPVNRYIAVAAMPSLGDEALRFLPDLIGFLDDPDALGQHGQDRVHGFEGPTKVFVALGAMGPAAYPAIGRLVAIGRECTDGGGGFDLIARTLNAIGASDADIAAVLSPHLGVAEQRFAWQAGQLLVELRPQEARRQVSRLIPLLGNDKTGVNRGVLFSLYALGREAQEAIPALIPLLKSSDKWVAEFAAHALGSTGVGSVKGVSDLADIVANSSFPLGQRVACAAALEGLGTEARSAVPKLIKVIQGSPPAVPFFDRPMQHDSEWLLWYTIVRALGRIGGNDPGLIPALRSHLSGGIPEMRVAAIQALVRAAGSSPEVLADCVRLLHDGDPNTQVQAASSIGQMQGERRIAIAPLMELLDDDNPYLRAVAAQTLGEIGRGARPAIAALRRAAANSRNARNLSIDASEGHYPQPHFVAMQRLFTVRQAAEEAIARIESAE